MSRRRDPSRHRNSRSMTGPLTSVRDGREHAFESTPERDALTILDVDYSVSSFITQPLSIPLGERLSWTPDIRVRRVGRRPLYVEVKPAHYLARDPSLRIRFDLMEQACEKRNADFEHWDERKFRHEHRFPNATLLRHSARWPFSHLSERVREIFERAGGSLTLGDAMQRLAIGPAGRFAVLGHAARGNLSVNIDQPIELGSAVTLRRVGKWR